ncbi:MAG: pyrroline-5-carboxylate reductase [Alphaproteobacteria bacterium]
MKQLKAGPILLIGCGKMGGALLEGWLARGLKKSDVVVVEPALDASRVALPKGVKAVDRAAAVPAKFKPEIVMLAVKPQAMDLVAPVYADYAAAGAAFVSIAAGKRIEDIARHVGDAAAIVRVMPNTPAAVGRGMSVLCANPQTKKKQRKAAEAMLAAVGETAWLDDESLMDAVTAVSGSGPAYVFLLIEAMAAAGVEVGLDPKLALQLAKATVAGAGELAATAADDPTQLRVNVTSPGGTTEAALKVLMAKAGLPALMTRAVKAAEKRGRQLAG